MKSFMLYLFCFLAGLYFFPVKGQNEADITIHRIENKITKKIKIDGDPSEWLPLASAYGPWTLEDVKKESWYDEKKNRLTIEPGEPAGIPDLKAAYYLGWGKRHLYFGAIVDDNLNDVTESKHAPKRWYYKDAIALFLEIPADSVNEKFGDGDHGFAFIADTTYPDYGSWWRHGSKDTTYIEVPGKEISSYKIRFIEPGTGNYVLEAKINWWKAVKSSGGNPGEFKKNPSLRMMIVHCDPDGGEYGGHLLIYGVDDNDNSWKRAVVVDDGKLLRESGKYK